MDLGFMKIGLEAFEFLESKYGFSCVEAGPWHLRYESQRVFVQIVFDGNRSYELTCSIGRLDDFKGSHQVPFDLGEVLRSEVGSMEDSGFQVTTSSALEKYTKLLARKLAKYGHLILIGDDAAFAHLADLRSQVSLEYAAKKRLEQTRRSLETSWRSKDYKTVVELLAPIQEWLDPSELRKLKYARKQNP